MQPTIRTDPERPAPVSGGEMLVRIGAELGRLAEHGTSLQVAVAAALVELQPAQVLENLQGLDLITQTLEALASVVAAFQRTAPANWPVDPDELSRDVGLHSLQRRLLGDAPAPHPAGAVDLW